MKRVFKLFISNVLIIFWVFSSINVFAEPFKLPEKFVYELTWTGIKAGTATLGITKDGEKYKIVSTAESADWVSFFYTVEDRAESIIIKSDNKEWARPVNYKLKIREGKHRKNKEVIFNTNNKKATYIDHLSNEKKEYDIPESVYDPISSFYYVRTLPLLVGESVYVTVFDSKKIWNVEVQVLRKEKVILPAGTFNTILIKPILKSEGIFSRKGDIFIWLTDDNKRLPVKMQTRVAVGSVIATMKEGYY
ncbi:MAG: DUF3108 domain-containing protein [Nitrospirae bacterium]|jgi:hypothetical protein|nr:DUF3108 domain-containing protein [Nitrospirota bacterium]